MTNNKWKMENDKWKIKLYMIPYMKFGVCSRDM